MIEAFMRYWTDRRRLRLSPWKARRRSNMVTDNEADGDSLLLPILASLSSFAAVDLTVGGS
jgi:hypothetical protein